jgi:hypothetical protein
MVGESITCAPGAVIDYFLLDGDVTDMVISFESCTFTRGLQIGSSSDVVISNSLSNSQITLTDVTVPAGRFALLAGVMENCSVLISGGSFSYTVPVTAALFQSMNLLVYERNATIAAYTLAADNFTMEVQGASIASSVAPGIAVCVRRDAVRMNVTVSGATVTADTAVYGISVSTNDDLATKPTAITTWGDFMMVDSTITIVKSAFGTPTNMTAVRLSSNRLGAGYVLLQNVACTVSGFFDISLAGFVTYSPNVTYVDVVFVVVVAIIIVFRG